MRDAGYTLAECLVALFVVGLSVAGLAEGARTIRRLEAAHQRANVGAGEMRQAQAGFNALLDGQGPFLSPGADDFVGSPTRFQFDCEGLRGMCAAWLTPAPKGLTLHVSTPAGQRRWTLDDARSGQFSYAGSRLIATNWPIGSSDEQALKSVGLLVDTGSGAAAITSAPVWIDQPLACEFDTLTRHCRRETTATNPH